MLFTVLASPSMQYNTLKEERDELPVSEVTEEGEATSSSGDELAQVEETEVPGPQDFTFRQVMSSPRLHLLVWPCGIILGLKTSLCGNLFMYLNAFSMNQYLTSLPYLSSAASLLGCPIFGWCSDRLMQVFPRVGYILFAIIFHLAALIVALLIFDFLAIMIVCLLVWTLATDMVETNGPAILLDEFGVKTFTASFGLIYAVSSMVTVASQLWMGMLYEMLGDYGSHTCYGLTCFTWNFTLCTFIAILALILFVIYLRITRTERKHFKYKFCAGE